MRVAAFLRDLVSWPVLAVGAVVLAFGLYGVNLVVEDGRPVNGWDVLVPVVANVQLGGLLLALGWIPSVIHRHRVLRREEVLIRQGSWSSACRAVITRDVSAAAAVVAFSGLVALVVAFSLGLPGTWSPHALEVLQSGGIDTETSASAAAHHFASPWLFISAQSLWLIVGLTSVAALHLMLQLAWGQTWANGILVGFGLYAVLASSGILGSRQLVDTTAWINLLWSLDSVRSTFFTVLLWLLIVVALATVVWRQDSAARGLVQRRVTEAAALLTGVGLIVAVGLVSAPAQATGGEAADPLSVAFGGQYSTLDGYVVAMLLPLVLSGIVAQRLADLDGGALIPVLMRRGSSLRWALRGMARGALTIYGTAAAAVVILAFLAGRNGALAPEWTEPMALIRLVLAYGGVAAVLSVGALILFWAAGDVGHWPLVAVAVVVVGYPFFTPASPFNPLAAFSVMPGTTPSVAAVASQAGVLALLVLCAVVLLRRSPLPRNF